MGRSFKGAPSTPVTNNDIYAASLLMTKWGDYIKKMIPSFGSDTYKECDIKSLFSLIIRERCYLHHRAEMKIKQDSWKVLCRPFSNWTMKYTFQQSSHNAYTWSHGQKEGSPRHKLLAYPWAHGATLSLTAAAPINL